MVMVFRTVLFRRTVFRWYPSRAKQGFGAAEAVRKQAEEEKGPALVFADATSRSTWLICPATDGRTLRAFATVRSVTGRNLGYGRFGAKIAMGGAPLFDHPDQFDPRECGWLTLTDPYTDIIYLERFR